MVQGNTDEGMRALFKMALGIIGVILLIIVAVLVGASFLIGRSC